MSLNRIVLVLNASYEPINITSARRALTLVLNGAAVVEERSPHTVRTAQIKIPIPSVVRLQKYRRMPRQNRSVSRKGIILRDGSTCQYCYATLPSHSLTLDHVIPRSRASPLGKTWSRVAGRAITARGTGRRKKLEWYWPGNPARSGYMPSTA